mgnify:CR=1 FL=1
MIRDTFNQVYFQFISDVQRAAFEITENFQPEGITQSEYGVLEYLYFFKGHLFEELIRDLYLSKYRGRKVVKSLLEQGYIKATSYEKDARKKVYHITRKGKAKLDGCFFQVMKNVQETHQHLDEDSLKNLIECMDYISKKLYKE